MYTEAKISKDKDVIFVTGTSSNLGISTIIRYLKFSKSKKPLIIIVTSRTLKNIMDTIHKLKKAIENQKFYLNRVIEFDYFEMDFQDMSSIFSVIVEIDKKYDHIDYLIMNASFRIYNKINWIKAIKQISRSIVDSMTEPEFQSQVVGSKTKDNMGSVFQANIFGPYFFLKKLQHLLLKGSKVIWVSSLSGKQKYLSMNDIQMINSPNSYEGSKRIIDLLHCGTYKKLKSQNGIQQYLVHPGIFVCFYFYKFLNIFSYYGMLFLFYLSRFLGSKYHNISSFKASNSIVSCLLMDLDQSKKIGSCTDYLGNEFLSYEEIDHSELESIVAYLDSLYYIWDDKFKKKTTSIKNESV